MLKYTFIVALVLLFAVSFSFAGEIQNNSFSLSPNPSLSKVKAIPLGSRYDDSLYFGTLVGYNSIGLTSAGTWEGAIRMTPAELGAYAGWYIIAAKFYHYDATPLNNVIKIYDNGSSTQPGGVLTSEAYTSNVPEWVYVVFTDSVLISGSGDLWASVEIYQSGGGVFPFGVDAGPAVDGKGDWVMLSGSWSELQTYGLDYNWQLCVFINAPVGINEDENSKTSTYNTKIAPNPMNVTGTISYSVPRKTDVAINIYDISGRLVKNLFNDNVNAGSHTILWDRKDAKGAIVPQGVYLYNFVTPDYSTTRTITVF